MEAELVPPLPRHLHCPPTPNNSSARHPSPCRLCLLTHHRLLHKVPGFSTLAAWSSGPPTHRFLPLLSPPPPPPPPPPLLTLPAPDLKPSSLQQRPNPTSWRETGRQKAQKEAKTCRRAGNTRGGETKGFLFFCFWMIGRDEVQQREKHDFCTLYTHIHLLHFIHTYTLSLSLTHTNVNTKKNSSRQKKTKTWTDFCSFHVFFCVCVCSTPVQSRSCSQKPSYLKTFEEDLHSVTHVR